MAREHVGECRPWPQQFREKKALCGLAAAAIVNVSKNRIMDAASEVGGTSKDPTSSDVSRILGTYPYGAVLGIILLHFVTCIQHYTNFNEVYNPFGILLLSCKCKVRACSSFLSNFFEGIVFYLISELGHCNSLCTEVSCVS